MEEQQCTSAGQSAGTVKKTAEDSGDPFEIDEAVQRAHQVEQQHSARVREAVVAANMTTAAAKDSMVRCKSIDERIKKFVKQANENADPEAQE
eukprot:COSAG01_NODE_61364_length_290_cov_0.518325_1_plen_92_part_10